MARFRKTLAPTLSRRGAPLVAVLSIAIAACSGAPAATVPAPTGSPAPAVSSDAGPATDYAQSNNWMVVPTSDDKAVDVFWVYGTEYQKANSSAPNLSPIDDAGMRSGAQSAFARTAAVFDGTANIYAPYYRQLDATYVLNLSSDQQSAAEGGTPTTDVTAAFTYFLEHYNKGRPFIVAGHSQGSDVLLHLLSGYLASHRDVYARMIAAYVIGCSVTPDYLSANTHLAFAERADDTGVLISYNTEAPTIAAPDPVVQPGALAINPITWTRSETVAPSSESLGAWLPDSSGTYGKVPAYADAQVDTSKNAIVTTTPDESKWAPGGPNSPLPAGVYHPFDYPFYFFDLQANAKVRVAAYLAKAAAVR
jgi:Protein of unknown function (DUF3089)